jgi:hypothetical protein
LEIVNAILMFGNRGLSRPKFLSPVMPAPLMKATVREITVVDSNYSLDALAIKSKKCENDNNQRIYYE